MAPKLQPVLTSLGASVPPDCVDEREEYAALVEGVAVSASAMSESAALIEGVAVSGVATALMLGFSAPFIGVEPLVSGVANAAKKDSSKMLVVNSLSFIYVMVQLFPAAR